MRTTRWVLLALAACMLALAVFLFILDHDSLVRWVADLSGYDKPEKIGDQLTPGRTLLVRLAPVAIGVLLLAMAWRPRSFLAPLHALRDVWRMGRSFVLSTWSAMVLWERTAFLLLMLAGAAVRLWLAATGPAHVDEAMTWMLFTSRGPLVAWTYYAAPNNHILHSLLTTLTAWLPIGPLLAMRVPSMLAALSAQGLLHLLLRRSTGPAGPLIAMALVTGCYPFLYYGYSSRGYMLVVLAFIVAYGAAIAAARTGERRPMLLLAIACTLGLFTMPSFLYPTALLYLFLLLGGPARGGRRYRLEVVRSGAIAGACTLLLYLPALMMSGVAAFTHNQWVAPIGRSEVIARWWPHFQGTFDWMTGTSQGMLLVLVLVMAPLLLVRGPGRDMAWLNVVLVLGSLTIPIVHGVIPFERTWIHLLVPVAVSVALLVHRAALPEKRAWLAVPVAALLLASSITRSLRVLPQREYMAYSARAMFQAVRDVEPKDIYCEFVVMGDHLLFDLRSRGIPYTYALSPEGAERDAMLASHAYTLLIVREASPITDPRYREVLHDPILRVYRPVDSF